MRRQLHHTVPRAYLKGFAEGKTVMLRRRDGAVTAAGLKRVAAEVDFYAFLNQGERDQRFESFLANEVDGPAAAVLVAIGETGAVPTGLPRADLDRWMAFQIVRTTHIRYLMAQTTEPSARAAHMSVVMRELGKRPEFDDLTRDARQRIAMDAFARTPPNYFRRDPVADLRIIARKAAEFAERFSTWQCHVSVADVPGLVTSDNPVAVTQPMPDTERWTAVLPDGADVQLAVNPRTLVVLTPYPHVGDTMRLPEAAVRVHNEAMIREAHQAVIHHPTTEWPANLVLAPGPPTLPPARVRFAVPEPTAPPTFPTRYPEIHDPAIAGIVEELGGTDVVE